jgi:nucleotide-binding universal stress UspA family protein
MLWTKILIAFDSSQGSWRAVEYVGQMYGRVDGIKVNLLWVYDKVPEYDMVETPFTDQVKGRILALERAKQEGIQKMEEAVKHLKRMGIDEDAVSIKPLEKKKGVAKDIAAEALRGEYGTIILGGTGKSGTTNALLGSVSSGVIGSLKGAAVVIVD